MDKLITSSGVDEVDQEEEEEGLNKCWMDREVRSKLRLNRTEREEGPEEDRRRRSFITKGLHNNNNIKQNINADDDDDLIPTM